MDKSQAEAGKRVSRTPWLTPFLRAWSAQYGGLANAGQLAKALRPLMDEPRALERWTYYLSQTKAQYVNPFKFAATFGSWDDPLGAREGESNADYAARLARE